jgi:hypothetical protein
MPGPKWRYGDISALEDAGLIRNVIFGGGAATWEITDQGWTWLAETPPDVMVEMTRDDVMEARECLDATTEIIHGHLEDLFGDCGQSPRDHALSEAVDAIYGAQQLPRGGITCGRARIISSDHGAVTGESER